MRRLGVMEKHSVPSRAELRPQISTISCYYPLSSLRVRNVDLDEKVTPKVAILYALSVNMSVAIVTIVLYHLLLVSYTPVPIYAPLTVGDKLRAEILQRLAVPCTILNVLRQIFCTRQHLSTGTHTQLNTRSLDIQFVYSDSEHADMLSVCGLCGGDALAAVEEYRRRFPNRRIPSSCMFSRVYRMLSETGKLPSVPKLTYSSEMISYYYLDHMIVLPFHYKIALLTQFRFLMDIDRFSRVPFNYF
ncbi:hypothetical protein ANN_11966 [Periplaneta americana]|uniref:DUF4817 domain-containing protein n=1 Tax=Periplaneta americana TaxID=6978 RepID=A0ABQ8T8A7_PERAM|nr:hypothetical protein ANN_11966 [Periplaneta americana]